jgi:hypothetical protein
MASFRFDAKKRTARIHFRYEGRQLNRVEKVESERHAERMLAVIEVTLIDLERGKLVMPPEVDVKTLILTGGKVSKRPEPVADLLKQASDPTTETIASIFDIYATTLTPGSKELNSIDTEAIHGRHFKRVIGLQRDRARRTGAITPHARASRATRTSRGRAAAVPSGHTGRSRWCRRTPRWPRRSTPSGS